MQREFTPKSQVLTQYATSDACSVRSISPFAALCDVAAKSSGSTGWRQWELRCDHGGGLRLLGLLSADLTMGNTLTNTLCNTIVTEAQPLRCEAGAEDRNDRELGSTSTPTAPCTRQERDDNEDDPPTRQVTNENENADDLSR